MVLRLVWNLKNSTEESLKMNERVQKISFRVLELYKKRTRRILI